MNGDNVFADFDDANNIERPSGLNFGGLLNNLVNTGGQVAGRFLAPKPAQPQQVTQPKPQPAWLLPVLIGGGVLVLLVLAGVLFGGRK